MLAPLFDKMTTHDLKRRFTAEEALEFFQNEYSELTEEQLGCRTYYDIDRSSFDCWDRIPPHLAVKWACHRTPPVPPSYPVLRWLCKRRPMEHVLPWIRWLIFSLVTFPRRVLKSLQTSFCALFLKKKLWLLQIIESPSQICIISWHILIIDKCSINFFPFWLSSWWRFTGNNPSCLLVHIVLESRHFIVSLRWINFYLRR